MHHVVGDIAQLGYLPSMQRALFGWGSTAFCLAVALVSLTGCSGSPCKHRGGDRADFRLELPIETGDGKVCFADEVTLELGYWGGEDTRLKQELMLLDKFVLAGFTEGEITRDGDTTSIIFYKDGDALSVLLTEGRADPPTPFRSSTIMQVNILRGFESTE